MKTVLNFFKHLLHGIFPTVGGGLVTMAIYNIFKNFKLIATGSGWSSIGAFCFAIIEIILALILIYELGEDQIHAKKWRQYKRSQTADTMNGSSCDCETSDEATNTYCDWE